MEVGDGIGVGGAGTMNMTIENIPFITNNKIEKRQQICSLCDEQSFAFMWSFDDADFRSFFLFFLWLLFTKISVEIDSVEQSRKFE